VAVHVSAVTLPMYTNDPRVVTINSMEDVNFIIDLAEYVLNNNYVQFGSNVILKQEQGIAIGTSQAVVIATIVMHHIHEETMNHDPFSDLTIPPPLDSSMFTPALEYKIDDHYKFQLTDEWRLLNDIPLINPDNIDNYFKTYELYRIYIDDIHSYWKQIASALIYTYS
jgi:hypothetical protein